MQSMDISLELGHSKEFSGEVVLTVDFRITASGCPAHMGSLSYPGHPAEPMEIEIDTIFWPCRRWEEEKREFVADHIEFPYNALPDSVAEGIETYIVEHYEYEPDYPI